MFNQGKYISVVFLGFGAIGILLFQQKIYLPVAISATVIFMAACNLVRLYRRSMVGPLTMLLFVVYAMPFIHVFPYIWFDYDAEAPLILWGLAVNQYMTDKTIIELMSMMGAVGATGFVVGVSFMQSNISMSLLSEEIVRYRTFSKTLSLHVFLLWVAIAFVLTWISVPSDTIFTAAYTESRAITEKWNFSSATRISYSFLIFTLADCMFEKSAKIKKIKRNIVFYSFLFIAIWFQLLRGDREILPCVIAAGIMYFLWGKGLLDSAKDRIKINWPKILFLLSVVFVVAYLIGSIRHVMVGVGSISDLNTVISVLVESGEIRFDNMISGTWSAVLLTPLSVAGNYINGLLPLKLGKTYLDLLTSIVPGFIADWIGFTRPIDAFHGPAWEMTYGLGGTHAIVVPFMDFRMAGIFIIVALWSFAFTKIEHYAIKRPNILNISLLGIIATSIPHWLWYGEKNIINALIIWLLLSTIYRMRFSKGITTSKISFGSISNSIE